ncbi:MAG: site-2 protease family protein [Oculatellaceae cyanobacterium Prado106]|jgi:Zn-dependent protease/CBS domain-containing protein|nr:site-2 protease family protein [Oculatellaceae cyanobacterium Prado106]
MNGNLRVGNLFGIPFFINFSWFVVLGLVTWDYGTELGFAFPQLGGGAWLLGLVAALLLFASVLAHELGHSFVAIRQGIAVNSITLFIFGGLASLGEESKTPAEAFWVAIAGPLVSIVLFTLLLLIGTFTPVTGPVAAVLNLMASINLALALFNLIPGLPLDGGNVLKAIVWKITGKPYKGIAFASKLGQFFGWLGVGLGALSVAGISDIGNFWTLVVGWFLLQNAGRYAQAASIQEQLSDLTAKDAVLPNSPMVSGELSLREFANNYIIGNSVTWKKYLVTDEAGQWIGEISVDAMKTIPTNDWWNVQVKALMQPVEPIETVQANQPLLEVVNLLEEKQLPTLVVLKEDGGLLGLLEKNSIIQLLQKQASGSESSVEATPEQSEANV